MEDGNEMNSEVTTSRLSEESERNQDRKSLQVQGVGDSTLRLSWEGEIQKSDPGVVETLFQVRGNVSCVPS